MGADWMIAPQDTEDLIKSASQHYPLDARQWLDLAKISASQGDFGQVDRLLKKAIAIRPLHRPTLWSAAQIALQTGDAELAERQLRQWLQLYPRDTGQALFIGSRWIDDPGELLDRMLPSQREYLEEAMEVALRRNDFPLADAVWQRLAPKPALDDPIFLQYVEVLLKQGEVEHAAELWSERDPSWQPGMLANGNFSRALGASLGLNWRRRFAPPGVQIERDPGQSYSSPASLKIEFNGKENVNLTRPWIWIPVEPGARYRLSGVWRADGLTTRALPYLQLSARRGRLRETIEIPGTDFNWTPWEIEFSVPEGSRLVRLQVRRDSTRAFDRNIDGTLWLDDFRLEPVAAAQPAQPLESAVYEALGRETANGGEAPVDGERFTVDGENREVGEMMVGGVGASPAGEGVESQAQTFSVFRFPFSGEKPGAAAEDGGNGISGG